MSSNGVPLGGTAEARPGPLDRAVDILVALADTPGSELRTLSTALGLPKSTVHRLLAQLEARSLVLRDGANYRLGPLIARLGQAAGDGDPLVEAARQPVAQLARELGETLFVVSARGGRLVVVHEQQGTGLVRVAPTVGEVVPVHATAAGRLYLAFDAASVSVPEELPRFTRSTPVGRRALDARVTGARKQGWDENVDEWIDGLSVLGAPVHASRGGLHGVLCLACGRERYLALGGAALAPKLVAAGRTVGRRIEGRKS